MNDSVTKLPLAMRFYLIGLIYRNSRMSCVCLASLVEVAHDRLYRVLYLAFPYSRRMWEWFAAHLVKEGYLLIDDTIWQRYGKKLKAVSFVWDRGHWQKSAGNQCRFIDLDRRETADSALVADMAERRKVETETRRGNALGIASSKHNSNVCVI